MKVSICNYSFFNSYKEGIMDVFGYLETIKYRYQLNEVDLWNGFFTNKNGPIWTLYDEDYIKKIRRALDNRGMTCVNMIIDRAHVWDEDKETREKLYENAKAHLRAAEILGAKTVRIDCGRMIPNDSNDTPIMEMNDEQFEYIVKTYREFSERGAEMGYKVGPENHMGPSLSPISMKKIAEAVDHPNYGILLHLDRWKEYGEEGDAIVAPWVMHTHFDGRTAYAEDALEKMNVLIEAGYDGYWSIEHNGDDKIGRAS